MRSAAVEQREAARARANRIRSERASWRRRLGAGEVSILAVLSDPPDCFNTATIYQVLAMSRHMGRNKATKALDAAEIGHGRLFGGLSQDDRDRLAAILRTYNPRLVSVG